MTVIKCPACGYDNIIFDDDKQPMCQICDSSLEPVQDKQDDYEAYQQWRKQLDEIPF